MTSATRLRTFRLTHNYIGVFFAPTILFFAITGGLQMFGLHESSRGSTYTPPALLMHLSQLHKKGTLYLPPNKLPSTAPRTAAPKTEVTKPDAPKSQAPPMPSPPNPLPMKVFFAATALALVLSTCTGLLMAWKFARRKAVVVAVFVTGVVCPLVALFL